MSTRSPGLPKKSGIHKSDSNPGMEDLKKVTSKNAKDSQNIRRSKQAPMVEFGIAFDVDGVIAHGSIPLQPAIDGIKLLQDEQSNMKVPVVFVTNALNRDQDKAASLSSWLNIPVSTKQMIQAPGPLEVFKDYHDKNCLLVGQGKIFEIAKELGFKKMFTVQDVADAYPLLDMVDHSNRRRVATQGFVEKHDFPRIEAIMFMGEPRRWESALQVLVDLLRTNGKPNDVPDTLPEEHIPVIACNMDLQFQDRANMPRYGHGAFLLCVEALWKKITGRDLKYTALLGKPSEITYRYAEHCLSRQARALGIENPLKRMYLIGDSIDSDIVGCNLYQRYLTRLHRRREQQINSRELDIYKDEHPDYDPELPRSRNVPRDTKFEPQSVTNCYAMLVCTGVYKPDVPPEEHGDEKNYHGHRDFAQNSELNKPAMLNDNVYESLKAILEYEGVSLH